MQIAYQQNHRVQRGADLKASPQYANTGETAGCSSAPPPSTAEELKKRCPKRYVDSTELYDAAYEGDAERVELLEMGQI
jgi:hypothetical protein